MKYLFDGSLLIITILAVIFGFKSNYLSYHNCMKQTKYNSISQKGAIHVAAQCRTFILEKAFLK